MTLAATAASAASFKGIVVDKSNSQPLIGVAIVVDGTTHGTSTDVDGRFELPLEKGRYRIVVSYISYRTQQLDIEVKETMPDMRIEMEPESQELSAVTVKTRKNLESERILQRERMASEIAVENMGAKEMALKGISNVQEGVKKLDDVSFTAYAGEILGIAGISGSGQKELLEAIAGLHRAEGGSITYIEPGSGAREELVGKDPRDISDMGVALSFVPEDRLGMGLVGDMDLADNMMLRSFRRGRGFFTDRKAPHKLAERVVEELEVNTPSIETPVRTLSGGNVQKVLVGREISSAPTVLLTAYAVRGLDINSSYTIYDLINKQKARGVAVVYVGEDLDVLLELADRILVLCGGKVSGLIPGRGATKRRVGLMMTKLGGGTEDE